MSPSRRCPRGDLFCSTPNQCCLLRKVLPLRRATLCPPLGDDMYAGVVRPALPAHDRMRLRGCLTDTGLERAHLTVTIIGDRDPAKTEHFQRAH